MIGSVGDRARSPGDETPAPIDVHTPEEIYTNPYLLLYLKNDWLKRILIIYRFTVLLHFLVQRKTMRRRYKGLQPYYALSINWLQRNDDGGFSPKRHERHTQKFKSLHWLSSDLMGSTIPNTHRDVRMARQHTCYPPPPPPAPCRLRCRCYKRVLQL